MSAELPPSLLPAEFWEWGTRATGAIIGSSISIAYLLPSSAREAALRFLTGVGVGLIFGTMVGHKLASELELHSVMGPLETTLVGSTTASICAWWGLGIIARLSSRVATNSK